MILLPVSWPILLGLEYSRKMSMVLMCYQCYIIDAKIFKNHFQKSRRIRFKMLTKDHSSLLRLLLKKLEKIAILRFNLIFNLVIFDNDIRF